MEVQAVSGLPPIPDSKLAYYQKRGRRSKAKGKAFEEKLSKTFEYYAEKGFAKIEKNQEPVRIIRSMGEGKFIACFTKKSQADYKGTIKGGRTVIFEAKYTESDRILQREVDENETAYIDAYEDLGARCFVICGFYSGNVYRVPWGVWKNMKRIYGHKYVTEEEIKQYQVQKSWNDMLLILN